MLLSEFSKMLGAEIEEYEAKPELSELKKRTVEFCIALEEKLINLPSSKATNRSFKKLVSELFPKSEVKKSKSCFFVSDIDSHSLAGLSTMSTIGSIGDLEEDHKRKDSIDVDAFDEMLTRSKKVFQKLILKSTEKCLKIPPSLGLSTWRKILARFLTTVISSD